MASLSNKNRKTLGRKLRWLNGREQRQVEEELGIAPCPICGYPLVARMGRNGPYFYCLCKEKKNRIRKAG